MDSFEWGVETVKLSVKLQGYSIGQKLQRNIVGSPFYRQYFFIRKKETKNFQTPCHLSCFALNMRKSSIHIDVTLDQQNIPEEISWHASDNPGQVETTKSFALSFWDSETSAIMRIDLWTKDMLVGEMKRFFLQSLGGMNETLQSATNDQEWYEEVEKTIQKLAERLQKEEASGQH